MRAVSLFSGIGGLDYGLELAGVQTVLQVENDSWCQSVLERHWPEVARLGDVREVDASALSGRGRHVAAAGRGADVERVGPGRRRDALDGAGIDLIHGGFPCQDVSVAGRRAGLSGERSGLWFEFERVLRELRPRWTLIENVPGLLSSGPEPGADFGFILRSLGDIGYGVAWRVLDARWFGVPQRRRRVFIVGCLGDAARAAQVLAVCESCGGYPATRSEAGQGAAARPPACAGIAGTLNRNHGNTQADANYVAATLSSGGHPDSNLPGRHHEDDDNLVVGSELDDGMARPLVARATGYRMDVESENFVLANSIKANQGDGRGWSGDRGDGSDNLIADTLRVEYGEQSYRGDGADNLVAFDWQASAGNDTSWRGAGRQHVVRSGDYAGAVSSTRTDAVAGDVGQVADPISTREGKTYTHEGANNFRTHNAHVDGAGVRRLTPLECERLQGFPDGWTERTASGHGIPDSHRYRMLGNAVATVCAQWLGHRLVAVDAERPLAQD